MTRNPSRTVCTVVSASILAGALALLARDRLEDVGSTLAPLGLAVAGIVALGLFVWLMVVTTVAVATGIVHLVLALSEDGPGRRLVRRFLVGSLLAGWAVWTTVAWWPLLVRVGPEGILSSAPHLALASILASAALVRCLLADRRPWETRMLPILMMACLPPLGAIA